MASDCISKMNSVITKIFAKHSLGVVYILLVGYLCGYLFPSIIAFLWQTTDPFIRDMFALSQSFSALMGKPWTLLAYSFFHTSFGHWFFNMVMLYFVGILFMNLFSPKRFLGIYAMGIIMGGLFFILTYQLFPVFSQREDFLLGASAGIMAVLIFLSTYAPFYRIYLFGIFSLPLWILGALLIIIDLASIPISNAGGHIAHLGGALAGCLYALYLKRNISFLSLKRKKRQSSQGRYPNKATEERINAILDKITKSGYDSLTREEKKYLFLASKENANQ
jgi:transmembrane rhomboid family protein